MTSSDLKNVAENVPDPTQIELREFYEAKQSALGENDVPQKFEWLKSVKNQLWKGEKPDQIPLYIPLN